MHPHVTSKELSERLKKLGVKQKSLFYWKEVIDMDNLPPTLLFRPTNKKESKGTYQGKDGKWEEHFYSAFLASELGEMLSECYVTERRLNGDYECSQDFVSTAQDGTFKTFPENSAVFFGKTEAEARGLMLEYLLTNHLITL